MENQVLWFGGSGLQPLSQENKPWSREGNPCSCMGREELQHGVASVPKGAGNSHQCLDPARARHQQPDPLVQMSPVPSASRSVSSFVAVSAARHGDVWAGYAALQLRNHGVLPAPRSCPCW